MVKFDVFDARDILSFPNGDNSTDTVFGDVHFNLTTLKHWNYTFYSNQTLSNGSKCFLTFAPYEPVLLRTNGSFVNATKCYSAINDIGPRGHTGIGMAVAFGIALVLTLTALAKHGPVYLPKEKRFFPIGRRWQWYWACFVCATAMISLFINIDVDRYYLQELPIVVTTFFWFLMCQGTLALTWEAVRHWGTWQERQYIDPNPFIYSVDDRRAAIEFWLPLWFYFWTWMNFFLVVPRSWKFAELQHSPEQTIAKAIPTATGARFKAAAFCLVISWLTICFSLRHSIQYYRPRNRGIFNRSVGFLQAIPLRFLLMIPLSLALIVYQTLISFVWEFSIIKYDGIIPIIYGWGYGPSVAILFIQLAYGWSSPNEDKELVRQRRERGESVDRELGIVKKPAWWRRMQNEEPSSLRDKIRRNVNEVGVHRAAGRRVEDDMERDARQEAERSAVDDGGIELSSMPRRNEPNPRVDRAGVKTGPQAMGPRYQGKNVRRQTERVTETVAGLLFPNNAEAERARRAAELGEDGPAPPPYRDEEQRREQRPASAHRTSSTSTTNSMSSPPQQIRSMLDMN